MATPPKRIALKYGMDVAIILKADQASGVLTYGKIQKILTSSPTHPHGIKVRLSTGEVGRVQALI